MSLSILENEFFTLLGPSGCGKTTLLRLIAGFDFPSGGDIRLYDESIVNEPPFRRPVNTVFQSYALFPHMTIRENVAFGLEMLDGQRAAIEDRVTEVLRLVRMDKFGQRRTDQISGGQAQRVALARALAPKPKLFARRTIRGKKRISPQAKGRSRHPGFGASDRWTVPMSDAVHDAATRPSAGIYAALGCPLAATQSAS